MNMIGFHPALVLLGGALVIAILPGLWRKVGLVVVPLLAVAALLSLRTGTTWLYPFLDYQLTPLRADALSLVFGLIFVIITFLGNVYALHVKKTGEHVAGLLYAGSSLGVVFAGDWLTLFAFWELMAASSVFLIWYRATPRALGAGFRYLLVHFLGGNLLLFGILLHLAAGGRIEVVSLTGTGGQAFWLILLGVAINAAIPPLHAWLTDAYPEATVNGSVFLSAFTTKVAVYVLIRVFAGAEALIWAGVVMALYGVIYAFLENNIRRLLAYHIVSQVGFMVAGVGMGTEMALDGSIAHAFSHILYKALLFMSAGAVIYATGKERLTELGGLARTMPLTVILYTIGAFSISGVPLFNGFVSKSIVISAAAKGGLPVAEFLLTVASVGTFLSISLKLLYFMFFGEERGLRPTKLPANMYLAMGGAAVLCIVIGLFPGLLYARLPYPLKYEPYTLDHVLGAVQLLVATGAGFWLLLPKLGGTPTVSMDTDWFYRKPLAVLLQHVVSWVKRAETGLEEAVISFPFHVNKGLIKTMPYLNENRYRLPVGLTIAGIVSFLGVMMALIMLG